MKYQRYALWFLCLVFATCAAAYGQAYVRLIGGDQNSAPLPASASNPVPVAVSVGGTAVSNTAPVPVSEGGVAQASITNTTASIAASDTTVTLAAASRHVIIKSDVGAAAIYVDLANGTATTADFKIDPAGSVTYEGPAISSFHYIGASAAGNISVLAW